MSRAWSWPVTARPVPSRCSYVIPDRVQVPHAACPAPPHTHHVGIIRESPLLGINPALPVPPTRYNFLS